jgi:flagellar assembly protein FliH
MSSSPEWRPGKPVLRGDSAQQASAASFGVDLRKGVPVDSDAVARVKEEARTTGYAEGWAQGIREAEVAAQAAHDQAAAAEQARAEAHAASLRRAVGALGVAADGLEQRIAATAEQVQDLIAEYAVQLAEAIVGRELADPATRGADAIRRAMALAPTTGDVTVSLNPEDHRLLALPDGDYVHDGRAIHLRPDPSLRPGDATAEAGAMNVDATITAAIARVREALFP